MGLVAGVLLCTWAAWGAPDQDSDLRQNISKEQQEMIDAAEHAYEASAALYEVGAGGVTLEGVYTWSRRWADAQAEGAPLGEQVKTNMAHRDRMKTLFDRVKRRFDNGIVGGERDKYEAARYYVAEAECRLPKSLRH